LGLSNLTAFTETRLDKKIKTKIEKYQKLNAILQFKKEQADHTELLYFDLTYIYIA